MAQKKYLQDKDFLKQLDNLAIREQYVRITALSWLEKPIQSIEGICTSGSVNLDGSSSVRRTCSLTVIADEQYSLQDINSLLSLNKKVKIEIGIKNTLDKYTEEDIIWFPLGLYIIINLSISNSLSGVSLSLSLRDKMCLLNGDVGGILPAAVNFNEMEVYNSSYAKNGYINVINDSSVEDEQKILITTPDHVTEEDISDEDDDKYALIIDAYKNKTATSTIVQPTIYQIIQELVNHFGGEQLGKIIISDVNDRAKQVMQWTGTVPLYICTVKQDNESSIFLTIDEDYIIEHSGQSGFTYETKTSGDNIGYIYTDFTYPTDLTGNAGDNVCTILDKIKNTLGNYEYFYDVEGNFVFQEIKNYLNTTQATVEIANMKNEDYVVDMSKGKSVYSFEDGNIISSFSNSPQYSNIKNDFIVWGTRTNAAGIDLPIRYHLAIDEKPQTGNSYTVLYYEDADDGSIKYIVPLQFEKLSDLPDVGLDGVYYKVKYDNEGHEIDENIFYIYDKDLEAYLQIIFEEGDYKTIVSQDWRTDLYMTGQEASPYGTDSNYYYSELANEWTKIYNIEPDEEGNPVGFKPEIANHTSDMDYFLDFIDSNAAIGQFSVNNIGRRQKVVEDNDVNCMFEPDIPDLVIIESGQTSTQKDITECENNQQKYVLTTSNIYSKLSIGKTYNSAYNMIRDLLYQYTNYNETITIQALPIFYLEPNIRISVRDDKSSIYGDYMINSISLPLGIGSTMSLNCTKTVEKV